MATNCICAQADSFNVRVSDLINPGCPQHGKRAEPRIPAGHQQIREVIESNLQEVTIMGNTVYVLDFPFGPNDIARKLLDHFEIHERKRR